MKVFERRLAWSWESSRSLFGSAKSRRIPDGIRTHPITQPTRASGLSGRTQLCIMKNVLLAITLMLWVSASTAADRTVIARFELLRVAVEKPVGIPQQKQVVTFYFTPGTPMTETVDVETTQDEKTTKLRLSVSAAGRLLNVFDQVQLPDIDYQKYFEVLQNKEAKARRGIAWLPEGGGAREVSVLLRSKGRTIAFQLWSADIAFYSHPEDETAAVVARLIDACGCALGSREIFF